MTASSSSVGGQTNVEVGGSCGGSGGSDAGIVGGEVSAVPLVKIFSVGAESGEVGPCRVKQRWGLLLPNGGVSELGRALITGSSNIC